MLDSFVKDCNFKFVQAMDTVHEMIRTIAEPIEQLRTIDYAMHIVRTEYVTYTKTRFLYESNPSSMMLLFPAEYYTTNGAVRSFDKQSYTFKIKIDDNVAVCARNCYSLSKLLGKMKDCGFIPSITNHMAYYYTDIDLTVVYNGTHSLSVAAFYKLGTVNAQVFDVSVLFNDVETNGTYWYDSKLREKLYKVEDYRIAILYECAKMKNKLLSELDKEQADLYKKQTGVFSRIINYYNVVGGAVGSGKSSFIGALSNDNDNMGEVIYEYKPTPYPFSDIFEQHKNVTEESTLSMNTYNRIVQAKKHGYFIRMFFIGIGDLEECLKRAENNPNSHSMISNREFLIDVYNKQFQRLIRILPLCNSAVLFDNQNGFVKVAEWKERNIFPVGSNAPLWVFDLCKKFDEQNYAQP